MKTNKPLRTQLGPWQLAKVLWPLLLLLIPLAVYLAATFLVAPSAETAARWMGWSAFVLAVVILIWTAIRGGLFAQRLLALRKRELAEQRRDPLYIVEMKMRERVADVLARVKKLGHKKYDLPIFLVIADKSVNVDEFLSGNGASFPRDLQLPQGDPADAVERWHVSPDGVFVDVSAFIPDSREAELGAFLRSLEDARPLAPINAALLLFSVRYMEKSAKEVREKYETALQKRLQLIQERLKVKYPSYLFVTDIDRIAGFEEFFAGLPAEAVGQILGWSNRDSHQARLDIKRLAADISRMNRRLDEFLLRRMERQHVASVVDRLFGFKQSLSSLMDAILATITAILEPDLYLDPVPLRGFYLTGGLSRSSLSSAANLGANATLVSDSHSAGPANETMVGDGKAIEHFFARQNWFSKDVFASKILREGGNIGRPNWVIKRQRKLTIAGLAVLSLQLVLFSIMVFVSVKDSSDWRSRSDAVIAHAQEVLQRPKAEANTEQNRESARKALEELKGLEELVLKEKVFDNSVALGRSGDILSRLKEIHSAIFEKYFLSDLIKKVESNISEWSGTPVDASRMGNRLIEYVRWANPAHTGEKQIGPFLDWSSDVKAVQQREFYLTHYSADRSPSAPRLVDSFAEQRIVSALEALNGSNRITLPLASGVKTRTPGEREWEWWQRVGKALQDLDEALTGSVSLEPVDPRSAAGDPVDRIYELNQSMEKLIASIAQTDALLTEGTENFPYWVASVENFHPLLDEAAKGWTSVENAVKKSQDRADYAYENLVDPILNGRMQLYQMFSGDSTGSLRTFLENLASERSKVNALNAGLYQSVGSSIKNLYKEFNQYALDMQKLIETSGALVATSDFYKEEEILTKLQEMRAAANAVTEKEKVVLGVLQELDGLLTIDQKEGTDGAKPAGKMGLKSVQKAAIQEGKEAIKDALEGDFIKREVSDKYQYNALSVWILKWQAALAKERQYILALYWTELFDWYQPIRKPSGKVGWSEVMTMGPFAQENEMMFVEGIDKFLQQWLDTVPSELVANQEKEEGPARTEISDFLDLYAKVQKFRSAYIPELRRATSAFVKAVRTLRGSSQESWKNISSSGNPDFSWDALQAFSAFKNQYEMNEGLSLGNVTGPLLGLENGLSNGINQRLREDFNSRWKELIQKTRNNNLNQRFPFSQEGESAKQSDIIAVCEDASAIGQLFGVIEEGDTKTASDKDKRAGTFFQNVISADRASFILKCHAFSSFIRGGGDQVPEVKVKIESAEIGKHYHWVRMRIGSTNYFDLGVYGEKAVVVGLLSNLGGVTFEGLDINRIAKSENAVTKGDLGLIHLIYLHGKSMDKSRKKWTVKSQLGASDADGVQIAFDMSFEFNTALPNLPTLPE